MPEKPRLKKAIEDYFELTRKPIYSFVMVVPFLIVYEVGLIIMHHVGSPQYRVVNGADDQDVEFVFAFDDYVRNSETRLNDRRAFGLAVEEFFEQDEFI